MLFDVGSSVVCLQLPESVREAVAAGRTPATDGAPPSYECAVKGSAQVTVGSELLSQWGLPARIVSAVRWYPSLEQAKEFEAAAAVVHLAVPLPRGYARSEERVETLVDGRSPVWRLAGIEPGAASDLASKPGEDHARVAAWLSGSG